MASVATRRSCVRLLPAHAGVDVTPFTARHPRADVDARAARATDLDGVDPVVLPLPRPRALRRVARARASPVPRGASAPVDLVHAPSPAVPPTGGVPLVVTVHDAAPLVMPEAFTRRGVDVPPAGLRGGGEAGAPGDRGVGRAAPTRSRRTPRSRATGSASSRTASTSTARDRGGRRPRRAHRSGSTTVRTCSGSARSSRARTCACCSTRSPRLDESRRAAPARARRAAGLEAPTTTHRGRARLGDRVAAARARSTATHSSRCSRAPTCSCSRAGTRASGSPCSRRWRRAPRWCAPTSRRSARSPATRRASSRPDDVDGWSTRSRSLLGDDAARDALGARLDRVRRLLGALRRRTSPSTASVALTACNRRQQRRSTAADAGVEALSG